MTPTTTLGSGIVLQAVPPFLQDVIANILAALPLIIGAIIILIIGWIVGRILGGIVKRIVEGISPSQYAEGTPVESEGDTDRNVAQALGDLTKYIVYFLAVLAALDYIGISLPGGFLSGIAAGAVLIIVAVAILVAGFFIGRAVGGIVASIVSGFGLDSYVRGTPLSGVPDSVGGIGNAAGRIVEYVIYFIALLIALDYVGIGIPGELLSNITAAVLLIVVAAVILILGFAVGRFVGDLVAGVVGGFGLDRYVRGTPLASATNSVGGVGNAVGKIVEYIIYYFALVAAVDQLQFTALVQPLREFLGQIPLLIGGLIILVVGIYVADLLGDLVADVDASRATDLVGLAVQLFVYYLVIVFALDTAGFDTTVLTNLFNTVIVAFFGALGLGLAIAIGIGLGWGSKDFVANNIDDWFGSAKDSASDMTDESGSSSSSGRSGGTDDEFESLGSDDDSGPGGSGPSGTGGSD